jgi:dolichol-phosphate mannosyltransferase
MKRKRVKTVISVIVPVLNEEGNIASLLQEIAQAAKDIPISEIIYVDDGSTDRTYETLKSLKPVYAALRIIRHDRRCGQSASLWTGIKAAGNDLVVTLDGDGQNDPSDIRLLYELYKVQEGSTPRLLVAGERKKRQDNLMRRLASRSANGIRSAILRDRTRDTGCSLKLFRRRDYLNLPYFNHMHRFLPALMIRDHVQLIHVPVLHRPRQNGVSKYGNLERALVGVSDLLGVWWLQKRPYAYPKITEDLN